MSMGALDDDWMMGAVTAPTPPPPAGWTIVGTDIHTADTGGVELIVPDAVTDDLVVVLHATEWGNPALMTEPVGVVDPGTWTAGPTINPATFNTLHMKSWIAAVQSPSDVAVTLPDVPTSAILAAVLVARGGSGLTGVATSLYQAATDDVRASGMDVPDPGSLLVWMGALSPAVAGLATLAGPAGMTVVQTSSQYLTGGIGTEVLVGTGATGDRAAVASRTGKTGGILLALAPSAP